ncbi:MAG: acyl--CoA ligase [Burkholderiales bacterium]|nr:acyl--CoA ligase [Burkholderiales bacterium]
MSAPAGGAAIGRHATLNDLYRLACKWRGGAEFLIDAAQRLSGAQAWAASLDAAACLRAHGAARGAVVAFLCRPSVRHALAWFAAPLAGAVGASLHLRETAANLGETVDWLGARVLVYDDASAALAAEVLAAAPACRGIALGALFGTGARTDGLPVAAGSDDLAAIILSSGTTGRPKGVMHSHGTLVANAKGGQALYGGIGTADATLVVMQPSFAAWVNVVVPYVGAHARVVFDDTFAPRRYLETLAREGITMAPAVPTMWRMILAEEADAPAPAALRLVSISGEPPTPADVARIVGGLCPRIASFLVSSESGCGAAVLATEPTLLGAAGGAGKPGTSGRPVVGADVRIVDPEGPIDALVAPGETGEICLAGASLALGYWRDPALTAARFVAGWWRSGDLGYLDPDGDLFVCGRRDNLINSGGLKIHGEEVERVLLAHPGVAQAAVVGQADPTWGERVEAYVVAAPRQAAPTAAALDAWCRDGGRLAGYKVPKAFHLVDALPVGPTGKLYRRGLRAAPGAGGAAPP